jgi:hypothetical protein
MPPNQSITNLIHQKIEFDGRPTSLRPEPEFWDYLREVAFEKRVAVSTHRPTQRRRGAPCLPSSDIRGAALSRRVLEVQVGFEGNEGLTSLAPISRSRLQITS